MTNNEKFQLSIIEGILTWLDNNVTECISIQHVSKYSGYSQWHLQRIFKKYTGVSLGCYVKKKQMYFAALDILETDMDILQVAMKYGYESQQTFTRAFKANFLIKPGRLRRLALHEKKDFRKKISRYPTAFLSYKYE